MLRQNIPSTRVTVITRMFPCMNLKKLRIDSLCATIYLPQPFTRVSLYSQRKVRTDTATPTINITTSTATSIRCSPHASPNQRPCNNLTT